MNHSRILDIVRGALATTWRIGSIVKTELVDGTGLRVDVDLQGPGGAVGRQEVWGTAGFAARPPASAEIIGWSHGDGVIVIATKSRTHEVAIQDGEVAMYNLGDPTKQTVLKIDADGNVQLDLATGAKMTATRPGGAAQRVATVSDVEALWDLLTGWTVVLQDGGGALQTAAVIAQAAASPIGSPALEADD